MTRTANSGYGIIRFDDGRGPVGPNEKGIIVATSEDRVAGWLRDLLLPAVRRAHSLRYAVTESEFDSLVRMSGMVTAFIETGFFGEAMIGCLDRLRKLRPKLRIVLFTVSADIQPDEIARYLYWGGGGFISLRDRPEQVEEQIKAVFEGGNRIPENILLRMREYDLLPDIEPYLTHQEIEIIRCFAREKTGRETARCLKISRSTVNKHLNNIYDKFGIHNIVGLLKLAVTQGILTEDELRSCRFQAKKAVA